jgi:hypothetical protein
MERASEMPMDFFLQRPDKGSQRDFHYFKIHILMMDELLEKRRVEIQNQVLHDNPFFAEADRREALKVLEDFGRIVRHNNFLAAVSMFEKQFRNLIDYFERNRPESERFKEIGKQSILQKFFNYIIDTIGVDISEQRKNLDELKKYYSYRNKIIHHIGYIDLPKDQAVFNFLKGFSSVQIEEIDGRTTILNNFFTIDFCSKAEKFIVEIFGLMDVDFRFRN